MANRVFHEGLKNQVWSARIECFRRDAHPDLEPVGKAHSLDFQIPFEKLQLLRQAHLLNTDILERQPEQVAQSCDHTVGCLRVLVNQGRDGVQGVEEKMRMELHPERLQLSFRQLRGELGGAQLSFSIPRIIKIALSSGNDDPVSRQILMKHVDQLHALGKSQQVVTQKIVYPPFRERESNAGCKMNHHASCPMQTLKWNASH